MLCLFFFILLCLKNIMWNFYCLQFREKAHRAKKSLQRRAILKEEKKAAALAAGLDWQSDSEDETLVNWLYMSLYFRHMILCLPFKEFCYFSDQIEWHCFVAEGKTRTTAARLSKWARSSSVYFTC